MSTSAGKFWAAASMLARSVEVLRHVLKMPRKGSIIVPCIALHCLFAFVWHLSLTLSAA